MPNLTTVTLTSGVPTAGTGTVSTLDNVIGTAGSGSTNVLTVQGSATGTALPVATHAVTQSGTWTVQPGNTANTTPWLAKVSDGTNAAAIKAASTSPSATDPSLVVAISPNSVNANGQATMANSAPVVIASNQSAIPTNATGIDQYGNYETVAASQTDQAMGATGATGDYLAGVLVIPGTSAAGAVSIKDGSGSAISVFAGGGTTALADLKPFLVPLGIFSTGGAWKITTGTNVTAIGIGKFT